MTLRDHAGLTTELCGNVADVEDLAGGDRPNIIGVESDHRDSRSAACDELDFKTLAGIVHVYNRADVTGLKTVIGQRSHQDYRIVLIHFLAFHRDTP